MILARELQLQRRSLRKIQASTGFEPLKIFLATNMRLRSTVGGSAQLVCERTGFDSRPPNFFQSSFQQSTGDD